MQKAKELGRNIADLLPGKDKKFVDLDKMETQRQKREADQRNTQSKDIKKSLKEDPTGFENQFRTTLAELEQADPKRYGQVKEQIERIQSQCKSDLANADQRHQGAIERIEDTTLNTSSPRRKEEGRYEKERLELLTQQYMDIQDILGGSEAQGDNNASTSKTRRSAKETALSTITNIKDAWKSHQQSRELKRVDETRRDVSNALAQEYASQFDEMGFFTGNNNAHQPEDDFPFDI